MNIFIQPGEEKSGKVTSENIWSGISGRIIMREYSFFYAQFKIAIYRAHFPFNL